MGDGVYSRVGSLVSEAESTNRTMRTKLKGPTGCAFVVGPTVHSHDSAKNGK